MKRSSFMLLLCGVLSGFVFGYVVQGHQDSAEQIPQTATESPIEPVEIKPERTIEKDLLLQAIHELDLTTAELAEATARIKRMELKAKRYDWLKNNGIQDHSLSFNWDTFKPSAKLLEFLGLDETEADAVIGITETALVAVKEWETDQATCITDTETNYVYKISPIPDSHKEAFRQSLKTILHPDDVELLSLSIDQLYNSLQETRNVSITFISEEEYAEQQQKIWHDTNGPATDIMRIEIEGFNEAGENRSSSSTIGPIGQSSYINERWGHLFTLDNFTE